MILNIFNDIWNKLNMFSKEIYKFIMNNFDNPFFWITIFAVLLVICYSAISNLANK